MPKEEKVPIDLGPRVTQAQLAEYATELPNYERLEGRIGELEGHFKAHRNEWDDGRYKLHVITGKGSSVKYASAVADFKKAHPEMAAELQGLVEKYSKPTSPLSVEVEDSQKQAGAV